MQTFSTIYSNYADLYKFIEENGISGDKILIQVFCGCNDIAFIDKVRLDILSILPKAKIIGATTRGQIFQGKSNIKTTVLSITSFNKTEVVTYSLKQASLSSFQMGKLIKKQICFINTKVMILFGNGRKFNGEEFLKGTDSFSRDVVIAGGLADRNTVENKSYIFTEAEIIEDGVVGAALNSEELYVNTDNSFGWIPIGKEHTITECNENIIKKIDNILAVEFYEKYMAGEKLDNLAGIANQFPLMMKNDSRFKCVNIVEIMDKNYLKMNYSVNVGEKVRFGYGNLNYIVNSARETFNRIKNYPVEAVFIYSCVVRLRFLKEMVEYEMQPLNKSTAVSGFFTCGEFGRVNEGNRFLSQTMTVLTLSEEENAFISIDENKFLQEEKIDRLHNKILFNLIKTSSDELEDMNNKLKSMVEEKIDEIKSQYFTDSLTKLQNRLKLIKDISSSQNLKLALMDVSSFNEINNFYGNKIGDILLISIGNKIKGFGDKNNFRVYRVNSDVFAILADRRTVDNLFIEKINELQVLLKHVVFQCLNQKLFINTSVGIALNEDNLFEKAGMALNYTKLHRKENQVYSEELCIVKDYENNLEWIKKLNEAIANDRITVYFQPIFNNKTCKIEKYEVLIRMIDVNGQVIPPFFFLNIARRAHIYPELTRIVINKAFEKFIDKDFQFSINLLVEDILNVETKSLIYKKLSNKNIAKNVIFEIVETEGIENFQEVMEFVDTVHGYGGKIAIDDFGTGYSNFKYLTKLKVDYIKIDGSLIKNICSDKTSELVTETIVDFASKLGIYVVAEFVTNKEVHHKVSKMGIDFSQGYYFSEPKSDI